LGVIKSLYLSFEKERIWLSVKGLDEAWVNGTYYTIKGFLSEKKPWFGMLGNYWWFLVAYFMLSTLIYAILIFINRGESINKIIIAQVVL
jgi:hypothetical protein